eukprot:564168-Prymnesium_polylepis.2
MGSTVGARLRRSIRAPLASSTCAPRRRAAAPPTPPRRCAQPCRGREPPRPTPTEAIARRGQRAPSAPLTFGAQQIPMPPRATLTPDAHPNPLPPHSCIVRYAFFWGVNIISGVNTMDVVPETFNQTIVTTTAVLASVIVMGAPPAPAYSRALAMRTRTHRPCTAFKR